VTPGQFRCWSDPRKGIGQHFVLSQSATQDFAPYRHHWLAFRPISYALRLTGLAVPSALVGFHRPEYSRPPPFGMRSLLGSYAPTIVLGDAPDTVSDLTFWGPTPIRYPLACIPALGTQFSHQHTTLGRTTSTVPFRGKEHDPFCFIRPIESPQSTKLLPGSLR